MSKKKTGSTALYMTYGEYLKKYPQGRKEANVDAKDYGYCVINNEDKNNICWLSKESFHLINQGFMALRALGEDPMGKKGMAGAKKIHQLLTKQLKISAQEAAKERKERAYIVQARDEFSDLMLNATAAQWAAILRLVKTVKKDADTIWQMTNEWKEKQKAKKTSTPRKRKGK